MKLNAGTGTGIGMLMPTWPTSISLWNLLGEQAYTVTKRVGVHQLDGVVQGLSFQYHEHRAKDFLGIDVHLGGHTREQGRADEVAVFVARNLDVANNA